VYHPSLFSSNDDGVKAYLLATLQQSVGRILDLAAGDTSVRLMEERLWQELLEVGRLTMGLALGIRCRQVAEQDIRARGLGQDQVRLRQDASSWLAMMTTFGPVVFFTFAYRDSSSGLATVTRYPAQERVYPLQKHSRSSELCPEWETRLGSDLPFRRAEESLNYFSHGAVKLEDTTIERHMVVVGQLLDRQWLYKTKEEIPEILQHRATRDMKTGKPIIYLSTDAHALRRLVDETWWAVWKMAKGVRLWCVDRRSGAVIHLGGEFTWGNCHQVKEVVCWLIATGRLPADGEYGEGLEGAVTIVSDGMPWIEQYVVAQFTAAEVILDAYHVPERLRNHAEARHGKKKGAARRLYDGWVSKLPGPRPDRGQKKRERGKDSKKKRVGDSPQASERRPRQEAEVTPRPTSGVEELIAGLSNEKGLAKKKQQAQEKLVEYLKHNQYRMKYQEYRGRGYQIGSGAMESIHRNGSQQRLKLPGPGWLKETSQAIFNLRMLYLCGRWEEFWEQTGLTKQLVERFRAEAVKAAAARKQASEAKALAA
jgi:hypothetical protein